MALSVKFALLTCLLFTGGMCWVVNQVGRSNGATNFGRESPPSRESVTQAAADRPPDHAPISVTTDRDLARSERLERPSPVSRSQTSGSDLGTVVEAEAVMEIAGDVRIPPPPMTGALLEMRTAIPDVAEGDAFPHQPHSPEVAAQDTPTFLVDEAAPQGNSAQARGALQSSTVYTVRKGDSLYRVCREFYGDKQAEGIKLVLAENPRVAARKDNMLQLGEVLELPPVDGANGMALDMGGMEASTTNTVRVLPNPDDTPQAEEKPQPREVPTPKLTQNTTRKVPSKKSPAKAPPPRDDRPKVRPSSPKPPPPSAKLAMGKAMSNKPRATSATEANRKTTGKAAGSKPGGKTSVTRKDAAAIAPKSPAEKRPVQPPKKNARRALMQESLEHEPPGLLARAGLQATVA